MNERREKEIKKVINRLHEYVDRDLVYNDFKKGIEPISDFEQFCINHCKDIETLLEELKDKDEYIALLKKQAELSVKEFDGAFEIEEKIIDLMAEFFNNRSWKEHTLKSDTCHCCKVEYGSNKCIPCIKQYFEKESE